MQIPLLALMSELFQDLEANYAPFGAARDMLTICNRVEHEGISFLTITLPSYYDGIMSCIEEGYLDPSFLRSFSKKRNKPRLFWGLIDRVFDDAGFVREVIDPNAVLCMRQLAYIFKKIKIDCSDKRIEDSISAFIQTDKEVIVYEKEFPEDLQKIANIIVCDVFKDSFDISKLIPCPGPGAVFENLKGNSKFRCTSIASSLPDYFGEDCIHVSEEWYHADTRKIHEIKYPRTRITLVPKTLKTPRIIAIEPTWTMMFQQSLKNYLYGVLENSDLTGGHVNFSDQSINQQLALHSSRTKAFATLDLSEASDRLGNIQVQNFFKANRLILDALMATRTGEAELPNKQTIVLNKFASMGSATCFPVESLCFYIATIAGVMRADGVSPSLANIRKTCKQVWVYGDDIIAPSNKYSSIVELFTSLGWKVNRKKSFYKSSFRESCGVDAFAGINITPAYLRTPLLPAATRTSSGFVSLLATANLLWDKHLPRASRFITDFVRRNTKSSWRVCRVQRGSGGVGVYDPALPYGALRWNSNLHRYEQKALRIRAKCVESHLEGHPALFKCLTQNSHSRKSLNRSFKDTYSWTVDDVLDNSLERTALRYASVLKHSWVPVNIH